VKYPKTKKNEIKIKDSRKVQLKMKGMRCRKGYWDRICCEMGYLEFALGQSDLINLNCGRGWGRRGGDGED